MTKRFSPLFIISLILLTTSSPYAMGVRPDTPPESSSTLTADQQDLGAKTLAAIIDNLPDSQFKGNLCQLLETGYMTIIDNDTLGISIKMGINWSYVEPGLIFKYNFDNYALLDGTRITGMTEAIIICGFKNLFWSTLDIVVNTEEASPILIENGELANTAIFFDNAMVTFDINSLSTKGFVDESYGVNGSVHITPFGMDTEETSVDIDKLMDYLQELKNKDQ